MSTSRRLAERPLSSASSSYMIETKSRGVYADENERTRSTSRSRNTILFLAANPITASRLTFDEECAAIERELRMTDGRDEFDFRSKWAVSADEMMRHFNELHPTVIHFCGHGLSSSAKLSPASFRGIRVACGGDEASSGLYLRDEQGNPQLVTARALKMMIKAAAASARVVVLNACYSGLQAKALRTVVDCVVGMTGAIRDDAARSFAVGFYRALGNRRSIGNAVEQAIATLAAKQLPDEHLPHCRTRRGIDAMQVFLTDQVRAAVF